MSCCSVRCLIARAHFSCPGITKASTLMLDSPAFVCFVLQVYSAN